MSQEGSGLRESQVGVSDRETELLELDIAEGAVAEVDRGGVQVDRLGVLRHRLVNLAPW